MSVAIGALLLTAHPIAIALTGVVPAIWLRQPSRLAAYGNACAYYAAAIWPVILVAHRFNGSWVLGGFIWAGAFLLLSVPWFAFHCTRPVRFLVCGVLATVASVLPPLGLIGVACPLSSAGLLFPACKIGGLFTACILPGLLAWRPKSALPLASAAVLFANLHYLAGPPRRLDWEGIDTVADESPTAFGDFQRIEAMLDRAEASAAKVIVFPEAMIRSWTPTTLAFFDDRIRSLRERGKTVMTGALIPQPDGYQNVVEAFGSTTAVFKQRVPVPFGMWNPFSSRGVHVNLAGPSEIGISGERITILICYEQLITWPALVSTFNASSGVVAIGSDYAIRGTPIAHVRAAYLRAWARLWSVPIVTAISI